MHGSAVQDKTINGNNGDRASKMLYILDSMKSLLSTVTNAADCGWEQRSQAEGLNIEQTTH
jgi:hypothetical protein